MFLGRSLEEERSQSKCCLTGGSKDFGAAKETEKPPSNTSWRRRCRTSLWFRSSDQRNTIVTWDFKCARYSWNQVLQEHKCYRELLLERFLLSSDSDWKIKPRGLPGDSLEGIHQWHIHSRSFFGHLCNLFPWKSHEFSLEAFTQ